MFLERRQAALQRYLTRIAKHPVLRRDVDFIEFLENPNECVCVCVCVCDDLLSCCDVCSYPRRQRQLL